MTMDGGAVAGDEGSSDESPDGAGSGMAVWGSASWRRRAVAWLDGRLAAAGITRTGDVEQPHLRPWATALRAPTDRGTVWLKAAGPGTAFEMGLYDLLARVTPDRVLAPIAVDAGRAWIVLPDGGETLGDALGGPHQTAELVAALAEIMPSYGRFQRAVSPYAGKLLDLGVADLRPAALPERFGRALDDVAGYVARRGTAADRDAFDRLRRLGPEVAAWCARLADAPGAASLDHNDLHPWNVLPGGDGGPRFYDWGDAVVAHPFASALVTLRFLRHHLAEADGAAVADDDPRLVRVRDGYLSAFADLAAHDELVATLALACHLGKIARAAAWVEVVRLLDDEEAGDYAGAPLRWLADLLAPSHLGAV